VRQRRSPASPITCDGQEEVARAQGGGVPKCGLPRREPVTALRAAQVNPVDDARSSMTQLRQCHLVAKALTWAMLLCVAPLQAQSQTVYDIVIANGRVIDPSDAAGETMLRSSCLDRRAGWARQISRAEAGCKESPMRIATVGRESGAAAYVDDVVPEEQLLEAAKGWLLRQPACSGSQAGAW
jgi:hypothetical protein